MTVSAAQDRETVVLIHGLWMHGVTMEPMRRRLEKKFGYTVAAYSYPSVARGLDANVEQLIGFLSGLAGSTIHLVGHSLGGVLALRALAHMPDAAPGRVVCLGSPLVGSGAARLLERFKAGDVLLGKLIREAVLRDPLQRYAGQREVGVIAGDAGWGIGVLLNALETDALKSPHDGTVSVAETRLPGIKDHLVMPVNHTWMLVSPDVADQVGHFIGHGEFRR